MAGVFQDRVAETTTTEGTGTYALAGPVGGTLNGFVSAFGDGGVVPYVCHNLDRGGSDVEIGLGTLTDAGTDLLARTLVTRSTNANNPVDWPAGTKDIFCAAIDLVLNDVQQWGYSTTGVRPAWLAAGRRGAWADASTQPVQWYWWTGSQNVPLWKIDEGAGDFFLHKNKLDATAPPAADDDESDGYSKGSVWIDVNASPREAYLCLDATATAAVWINTTLDLSELGTAALVDVGAGDGQVPTGAQLKGTARGYTAQQYFAEATLIDGATIDWDLATGQSAKLTLGGNRTMNAPTNLAAGATYKLRIIQDATGNRTLAWDAIFKWPGGSAPILSTGPGAIDIVTFDCDGTNLYGAITQDYA